MSRADRDGDRRRRHRRHHHGGHWHRHLPVIDANVPGGLHPHWRRHHRWRHYFGAHLHRRIFMWFGAAIFATTLLGMVFRRMSSGGGHRALFTLLVIGGVVWLVAGKIARRIAQPLYELVHVAQEIGAGRLKTRARVPPWHIGEIAVLAQAVNDMADRIERQIADQRELLAGVSHEIRTPLARIRVLLELARAGALDARGAHTVDELEREVLEIDALVGELLASARLDFAALTPRPLDGGEVARRALERAGIPAGKLSVEATDAGFAGDPTLMARALANLIDNARKHAGGVERARVRAEPGFVLFDVEDRGPGFPAAGAGSPAERPVGSLGLGLVLVRRIADAHKGRLEIANRAEGGARVTLVVAVGDAGGAPAVA
ncbi:MAG TPA: HAMP domain-containing sensor histidine kinase [Polyangia bacterium]|nr:HAMP domain-containing sensor histidine kinase [Polyangia bacterium]